MTLTYLFNTSNVLPLATVRQIHSYWNTDHKRFGFVAPLSADKVLATKPDGGQIDVYTICSIAQPVDRYINPLPIWLDGIRLCARPSIIIFD